MLLTDKITADMIYNQLTPEIATERMNDLKRLIYSFLDRSKLRDAVIEWNDALLLKIIIRVDQRRDYFTYFHSEVDSNGNVQVDKMSQYKQVALLCFWIMKYKPLRIVDPTLDLQYCLDNHCTINETFAAYIFISQIMSASVGEEQKTYYMSDEYINDLRYKFMHHDLSKEAMIFALCSIVCCK